MTFWDEVQLSVAVADPVMATFVLCSHESVIGGGMVSWGGVLSMITMVWIQTATFPHISRADQCLVNDPVPLQWPRFSVWSTYVIVIRLVGEKLHLATAITR